MKHEYAYLYAGFPLAHDFDHPKPGNRSLALIVSTDDRRADFTLKGI